MLMSARFCFSAVCAPRNDTRLISFSLYLAGICRRFAAVLPLCFYSAFSSITISSLLILCSVSVSLSLCVSCSHFVLRVILLHAPPVSFHCSLLVYQTPDWHRGPSSRTSFHFFGHLSVFSSLRVFILSVHSSSFTLNCILSPCCLLSSRLYIPSISPPLL